MLKTETPSDHHKDLDLYPVDVLVQALVEDQQLAFDAVRAAMPRIAEAARSSRAPTIGRRQAGLCGRGHIRQIGRARQRGAVPHVLLATVARVRSDSGRQRAMFEAVEGAEDDAHQASADLQAIDLRPDDVVILLAASGTTPYVVGALQAAKAARALTIGIANNPHAPLMLSAQIAIALDTGSEVISGSTRLKAGTAQKIVLNTLSSAIMVRLDKVYGNLMVDLRPTNSKLIRRAEALTMRATGADEATARDTLSACGHQVKVAIVAITAGIDVHTAQQRLELACGSVRVALGASSATP